MNTRLSNTLAFTVGVAAGASVTYILIKKYFDIQPHSEKNLLKYRNQYTISIFFVLM